VPTKKSVLTVTKGLTGIKREASETQILRIEDEFRGRLWVRINSPTPTPRLAKGAATFTQQTISAPDVAGGIQFESAIIGLHSIEPICSTGSARFMAFSATGQIVTFSSTQTYYNLEFLGGFNTATEEYQLPGLLEGDELIAVGQIGPETNKRFFGVTRDGLAVSISFSLGEVVADCHGENNLWKFEKPIQIE
jgi:hypothetical protein